MQELSELIAAFRAGNLKLPAVFDALTARGAVPDAQYARDVAWLTQQGGAGEIDPAVVRAVLAKLASLQPQSQVAPADVEEADDATQLRTATGAPPAGGADSGDATRVVPPSSGAPPDDGTVVRPDAPPVATDDSATVVHPASRPQATGTHTQGTTSGTGSLGTSTWQRVASENGGESATVGMLLKGRFLLERELGRGGMGVVYLARDERKVEARDRDPYVAVKVLNDEFRRHPDSLIALQREARRSQQLAHDNIVRVYDFDKDRTIVFMTMEYIDGTSLKTLIRERAYNGLPIAEARPLIEGMAWALRRAHVAGVVHSDFKPGNVMVTREGVAKVFDFGIARAGKHLGAAAGEETVFDAGTLGALTPAYASLEMLRGGEPTAADDIYALGCVVYELLTGKHPFDKVSAEVALKEGRKPPHVRGLTKRQNQTLRKAVAFHREQRLQSAMDLIEGLRKVGWAERARPLMIYGAIVLVLAAVAAWGVLHLLNTERIARVVDGFALAGPKGYANEDQAYQALQGLGEDESRRVVVDDSAIIERYLGARLDAYWNPAQQRYDYAGVQHVFAIRDRLKLYSPQLDVKRLQIDQQRNELLNTLDTELSQRIAAGAIFTNQPDNVVGVLDTIRKVNPHSELLDNAELQLKYDIAIGQSLDAGRLDEARQRLALATRLFPKSARLQQRAQRLASLQAAKAAAAKVAAAESVPEARKALADLVAKPSLSPEWQAAAGGAMQVLRGDNTPETRRLVDGLVRVIATEAAAANTPDAVKRAESLVAMGLMYAPSSQPLLTQFARFEALERQQQAQLAQESATAEVASRIESMKRAAAAFDVDKAQASLDRIRTLQPNDPFLTKQGPALLAQAYAGRADLQMNAGDYRRAVATLDRGLQALDQRDDLRHARARDAFAMALQQAGKHAPSAAEIDHLKRELDALRKADAQGLATLESSLKQHKLLPAGSFADTLAALRPGVAAAAPAPTTPAAPGIAPAPASAPAAPGRVAVAPGVHPAGSAPAATVQPGTSAAPTMAAQADPCARANLVGRGRVCADSVGSGRGPALVVVPGIGGGRAYGMTRTEITAGEFDRFCAATHQCSAKGGDAGLPISDISLGQAKAYAAWLTKSTGYTYRLPTDAEWTHAAAAGQGWTQAPDSNCILPSAGGGGGGGPISARGREPNPWGLVNLTGNVWEWVVSGGGVMVRGGSYNSYWSDCTAASRRSDSGQPQADVGFRLVRELR